MTLLGGEGKITLKAEKFFNQSCWYHGTTLEGWISICKLGIRADFNIGISLDFGNGFYLSNSIVTTERYVKNIVKYASGKGEGVVPVVIQFEFVPLQWILQGASYRYFEKYNDTFAEFVFENRLNYQYKKQHPYDITAGVTTDAKPTWLMQQYFMGKISKQAIIEELKRSTSVKQMCLHRQEYCDFIKPSRAYILDGKELDVNEYYSKR